MNGQVGESMVFERPVLEVGTCSGCAPAAPGLSMRGWPALKFSGDSDRKTVAKTPSRSPHKGGTIPMIVIAL